MQGSNQVLFSHKLTTETSSFQPFPCFLPGTDVAAMKNAKGKAKKCACRKGYSGLDCGVPAPVGGIEQNSKCGFS